MIEKSIIEQLLPFIIPAFLINILLDIIKNKINTKYTLKVMPILALIISLSTAILYAYITEKTPTETFMHSMAIIGISLFCYDIGGYKMIKSRIIKYIKYRKEK